MFSLVQKPAITRHDRFCLELHLKWPLPSPFYTAPQSDKQINPKSREVIGYVHTETPTLVQPFFDHALLKITFLNP